MNRNNNIHEIFSFLTFSEPATNTHNRTWLGVIFELTFHSCLWTDVLSLSRKPLYGNEPKIFIRTLHIQYRHM